MIKKLSPALVFCFAILACLPLLNCENPAPGPLGGAVVQPYASSPQYDPTEPEARRQLTVDERIYGTSSVPAGGPGLMWSWSF